MGVWSPGPGATAGNDTFTGDGTHETASGLQGDDTLDGNGGNDSLTGHAGADTLNGGAGDDSLYGGSGTSSNPTAGVVDLADILNGGDGNDVLRGQTGDDHLNGGDGVDNLRGDLGNDTLDGGAGEDFAAYRFSDLGLASGVTFSAAGFTNGGTFSDGRGGMDTLISIERIILTGTSFADQLTGSAGRDQISTFGGHDIVNGGDGDDRIFDNDGNATLYGGAGDDEINIDAADVNFAGFAGGVDFIDGGAGVDIAFVYASFATVSVTATLYGSNLDMRTSDNAFVVTGVNIERLSAAGGLGNDTLTGGAFDDYLWGDAGDDVLSGGGGSDVLTGGFGDDVLNGGAGLDRYDANNYNNTDQFTALNLDFSGFDVSGGTILRIDYAGYEDTLISIEGVLLNGRNGSDIIIGSNGADTLDGRYGADTVNGGDGDDIISGAVGSAVSFPFQPGVGQVAIVDGNDTFIGAAGYDTLTFLGTPYALTINAATGTATSIATATDTFSGFEAYIGGDANDEFIGAAVGETFSGSYGDDTASGNDGNDTLNGDVGNDTLNGGAGADTLRGGVGRDTISGGAGDDLIVVETNEVIAGEILDGGADTDRIVAFGSVDFTQTTVTSIEAVTFANDLNYDYIEMSASQIGAGFSNALAVTGTAAAEEVYVYLSSGASIDLTGWTFTGWNNLPRQTTDSLRDTVVLVGAAGAETIVGTTVGDSVFAGDGNDTVSGGAGSDYLRGEGGNDTLSGGAGDDVLRGGVGVDTFIGGDGSDRISFFELNATQAVVVSLLTQTISNDGFGNAETMSSIEELGAGTVFADTFEGDNGANLLLVGRNDTANALAGDDTFQIDGAPQLVNGGDGNDTILLYTLQSWLPDNNGDGNAEPIFANHGVIVHLGAGLIVDDGFGNSGSLVSIENSGGSTLNDQITGSALNNNLSGNDGDDVLVGLAGADILEGELGNDYLFGGEGADSLLGGAGSDTASYATASAGVYVFFGDYGSWTGDAAGDSFTSIENITGTAFNDLLGWDNNANVLDGGAGDDILYGNGGADALVGGSGFDIANYQTSAVGLYIFFGDAAGANGDAAGDTFFSIEGIVGSNFNDVIGMDNGDNMLVGGGGNDVLYGNGGGDRFFGNDGFDTVSYATATSGVYVYLRDLGHATGDAAGDGDFSSIESIVGSNFDDVIGMGDFDDLLIGGGGNDVLYGLGGADRFFGNDGFDTVSYAHSGTGLYVFLRDLGHATGEAAGDGDFSSIECIVGSNFDDILGMGDFGDTLVGGGGNDQLYGLGGNDTLYGGAGADRYMYTGAGFGSDTIMDWQDGQDRIDFSRYSGATFSSLTITQEGGGVRVSFGADNILIAGAVTGNITSADFIFGP